jgi:aminobenzoyl-glutamate utilization protein B
MNVAWNYRREHLRPEQRSHYVIVDGGDQPNVVPSAATVWYFVREIEAAGVRENFATLDRIAEGAALMTDTTMRRRIVGAAWPRHMNKAIALAMDENIQAIGLPQWSPDDQAFAKALQRLMGSPENGLPLELQGIQGQTGPTRSGGSDDIGDVSWVVPTVTLGYPSNVEGMIFHHWSSAMAMATPIAHKGATSGAKVVAMTVLDLLENATLRADAWRYFREEQLKGLKYEPFIGPNDAPPTEKNADTMAQFRERQRAFFYDPTKYDTYLKQLGIDYPQLERPANGRRR